ncbi:MAG: M20/M25/M40 family metallo-hydrolase [Acidobacteriota bacterium]|nr:M20/M25/M40 family metallo-hydrolase [Acidobacteriota bacterium]
MKSAGVTTVLDRLMEFISIQSVSGDETALADRIAQICADAGVDAKRDGRNVWARRGGAGPCLLLNSHIDTVPAVEGWSGDPWAPRIDGDRLVGLGASDAKASVAAMLEAFLTAPLGGNVRVIFAATCDEETGGQGLEKLVHHLAFDAAIVGEPNGFRPAIAQKGLLKLKLTAHGRAGHAARPELAENAIVRAAKDVLAIERLAIDAEDPYLGRPTAAATIIHGGIRSNVIPDVCEVTVDARTIAGFDNDSMLETIRGAVESDVTVLSSRLRPVGGDPGWKIARAASEAAGGAPVTGFPSVSDLAHLGGKPAVVFGPGDPAQSHATDESIDVAAVLGAPEIYRRAIAAYFA